MGWKEVPAEELLERAEANGYKQGAHQAEDSIKDNTKYVRKTLKDQNWALGRYEKWVQTSARSCSNFSANPVEEMGRWCREEVRYESSAFR